MKKKKTQVILQSIMGSLFNISNSWLKDFFSTGIEFVQGNGHTFEVSASFATIKCVTQKKENKKKI